MYCQTEAEGKRRRHQMDTVSLTPSPSCSHQKVIIKSKVISLPLTVELQIVEGIGLNRSTQNFDRALHHITDAIR